MHTHDWDVIVAGGGPAGLSAAMLLGRARRRVLVIDAGSPRNRFAEHMHGVLGNEGVAPAELLARGRAEVAEYGVETVRGTIDRVHSVRDGLTITTEDGHARSARALVVATGLRDELPEIPGLAERWGTSVLHCPYCHGWEVRDRRLGVLTTSPLSLHQAELIRQWTDRLTVFTAGLGPLAAETEQRLKARGIELVAEPVTEILGDGATTTAVRLANGNKVPIDAIFTGGIPRPLDHFLAPLALDRTESPFGSFLTVDVTGKTSDDHVWAIGNVVNPGANVPMSIGAGAMAGGAVNGALVTWDFDDAVTDPITHPVTDPGDRPRIVPAEYWEDRYAGSDRVWSGNVNKVLSDIAGTLEPGTALDLGCGEGGDVIWLARHGWTATGIDISPTAIQRATEAARAAGLARDQARFVAGDLAEVPAGSFDLVTASFLHSPVDLPRESILREAAGRVAPGGHLLITSHTAFPLGANVPHTHDHVFLTPREEVDQLSLDPQLWEVLVAETRQRAAVLPDGTDATLDDAVVLARRLTASAAG